MAAQSHTNAPRFPTQFNLTVHGLTGIGNNTIKHKVSREKTLMVFVDFKPHKFYQYPIVTVAL